MYILIYKTNKLFQRPSLDSVNYKVTSNNDNINIDFPDVDENQIEKVHVTLQSQTDKTSQVIIVKYFSLLF